MTKRQIPFPDRLSMGKGTFLGSLPPAERLCWLMVVQYAVEQKVPGVIANMDYVRLAEILDLPAKTLALALAQAACWIPPDTLVTEPQIREHKVGCDEHNWVVSLSGFEVVRGHPAHRMPHKRRTRAQTASFYAVSPESSSDSTSDTCTASFYATPSLEESGENSQRVRSPEKKKDLPRDSERVSTLTRACAKDMANMSCNGAIADWMGRIIEAARVVHVVPSRKDRGQVAGLCKSLHGLGGGQVLEAILGRLRDRSPAEFMPALIGELRDSIRNCKQRDPP